MTALLLFCGDSLAQEMSISITSPTNAECVNNVEDPEEPYFEQGILNGNNLAPRQVSVDVEVIDPIGQGFTIHVNTGPVVESFPQPPDRTCPDWNFGDDQVEACDGQGYCIFTRKCICFDNNDCNAGAGVCRESGVCGCANDGQCGEGQRCNAEGACLCADDSACAAGQTCLNSGVCSCAVNDDCGEGLLCSDGVCSQLTNPEVTFIDVQAAPLNEPLPRTINATGFISDLIEDAESLSLKVSVIDTFQFPQAELASDEINFKLDRAFPLLSNLDFCQADEDCPVAGEACDLFLSRCLPANEIRPGACRDATDFSQGLSADFLLEDNFDENPTFELLEPEVNGCSNNQRLLLSDSCGNAQVVNISNYRAPNPGEVTAQYVGYRCFESPCYTGEGAEVISSGDTVGRGLLDPQVNAPFGCYDYFSSQISTLDEEGNIVSDRTLFSGEILQALPASLLSTRLVETNTGVTLSNRGPYQIEEGSTLILNTNDETIETVTFTAEDFFDLNQALSIEVALAINEQVNEVIAILDGNSLVLRSRRFGAGVTLAVSGTAADDLGFTAEQGTNFAEGSGDGSFRANLAVYACGEEVPLETDSFDITISSPFIIEIGGPYNIDQGEDLTISASESFIPIEFGGISLVEWDLDGDGIYELVHTFDPVVTSLLGTEEDLSLVSFDSSEDGLFIVSFRITTGLGEVQETRATVTVADIDPICRLPENQYTVREGQVVTFDATEDSGASDPSDPVVSYQWDFGDGTPIGLTLEPTTTHIYQAEGDYTLTLTVADIDSECPEAATALVQVGGVAPIIEDIGLQDPEEEVIEGESVVFTAGNTRAGAPSDPISSYLWDFGYLNDGQPVQEEGEQLVAPEHTYDQDGDYSVCLTVSDTDDEIGPSCFDVSVIDLEPTVIWDGPIQGVEGETLTFDGTGTVSGGVADELTQLRWSFSDGSPPELNDPENLEVSHTFVGDGTFTVRLTAIDEDSEAYFERTVEILDVSPNARLAINYPDPEVEVGYENEPLELDASESFPGAESDPITLYHWDFGDESVVPPTQTPITTHAWPDGRRIYQVTVTVEDSDGSVSEATSNVTIENVDPLIEIRADQESVEVGSEVTFSLIVDDVPGDQPGTSDQPLVIEWDMGDGTPVYQDVTEVTHIFQHEGAVVVHVTFADGDGGEVEGELPFVVEPRSAEILDPVVTVTQLNGELVEDPNNPLGEFSEEEIDEEIFYVREGEELVLNANVRSALLSNQTLDVANAVWVVFPDGATPEYLPVTPPMGEVGQGNEEKLARLTWRPNYFQAGNYLVRLTVEGEVTGSITSREWRIRVVEGGSPMLAATSGSFRRGRVILYQYDKENDTLTFTPNREVDVGLGSYDVLADESLQRLFVSSPGSGHVAVLAGDPARVVRQIPTGAGAYDMTWGGDYLWVVNAEAGSLSAINPNTLKVVRDLRLPNMPRPMSIVWAGEAQGLEAGYLFVGDGRNGNLSIINAEDVISGQGEEAIDHSLNLGGSLSQMIIHQDQLVIADAKTRQIYSVSLTNLVTTGDVNAFNVNSSIPFSAQDLLSVDAQILVATGSSLYSISPDGETNQLEYEAERVSLVDPEALGTLGLLISNGTRLDNYAIESDGQLTPIIGVEGTRVQRLTTYISHTQDP